MIHERKHFFSKRMKDIHPVPCVFLFVYARKVHRKIKRIKQTINSFVTFTVHVTLNLRFPCFFLSNGFTLIFSFHYIVSVRFLQLKCVTDLYANQLSKLQTYLNSKDPFHRQTICISNPLFYYIRLLFRKMQNCL